MKKVIICDGDSWTAGHFVNPKLKKLFVIFGRASSKATLRSSSSNLALSSGVNPSRFFIIFFCISTI